MLIDADVLSLLRSGSGLIELASHIGSHDVGPDSRGSFVFRLFDVADSVLLCHCFGISRGELQPSESARRLSFRTGFCPPFPCPLPPAERTLGLRAQHVIFA